MIPDRVRGTSGTWLIYPIIVGWPRSSPHFRCPPVISMLLIDGAEMSIGLRSLTKALVAFNAASASVGYSTRFSPAFAAASEIITAPPPDTDTAATSCESGTTPALQAATRSISSFTERARSTPYWANRSSTRRSSTYMDAVCPAAASPPRGVVPTLSATTGFRARRASSSASSSFSPRLASSM